jgi:hypothetical protein
MSAYHVWNPFLVDKDTLEFIVTTADSDQIAKGTDEFIAGILKDIGLSSAKPGKWTLDFARTPYFSEYPDSDDWRDRWQPVWRATVKLKSPPAKPPTRQVPYFETNSTDDSWSQKDYHGKKKTARALIIADFKNDGDRKKAEAAIKKIAPKADFIQSMVKNKYPQLQIDLGEQQVTFFEKVPKLADDIAKAASENGGVLASREFEWK